MRKQSGRRLTWEATQGAARIVLIKEGRLVLSSKRTRQRRATPQSKPNSQRAAGA